MNSTIETYNALGKKYLDDIAPLVPAEREEFIERLQKGSRVLDVGCAGGRDSKAFAEHGFEVIGIDLVDIFLEEAQSLVPGATFKKMDTGSLDFPDQSFDAVWANAVLMHVSKKDILRTLKGLYRVCKPGALLFISVKYGKGEEVVSDKLSRGRGRLFSFFTEDELSKYVEQVGFTVELTVLAKDDAGRKEVRWVRVWAIKG